MRAFTTTRGFLTIKRVGCLVIILSMGAPAFAVPYPTIHPGFDPLVRGRILEKRGRIEEARELYREVIKCNPNNVEARRALVDSYVRTGLVEDSRRALSELAQALVARPDYARGWLLAADLASKILLAREGPEDQRKHAKQLLEQFVLSFSPVLSPGDARRSSLLTKLGGLLRENPDSPDVTAALTDVVEMLHARAIERRPDDVEVLSSVAGFYWSLSAVFGANEDNAQNALEVALAAADAAAHDHRALALAGRAYQLRAEVASVDAETQEGLEQKRSLLNAAEDFYKRALLLRPASPKTINGLAFVYAAQEKTAEGVEYFQSLIQRADDDTLKLVTMQVIANLYAKGGQTDKAEAQWLQVREAYPNDLGAYMKLSQLYLEAGQNDEAVALLDEAVRKHPAFLNAHVTLGRLHVEAERMDEGREHFLAAVRLHDADTYDFVLLERERRPGAAAMSLFHEALMGLWSISFSRREYSKAGDIITQYRSVYFATDSRGTALVDSDGHPIPRSPAMMSARAMLYAGTAYHSARRRAEAIACLKEAVHISNGKFYAAHRMLARAYLGLLDLNASDEEKLQAVKDACEVWREVRGYLPNNPTAQMQCARLMFDITKRSPDQIQALREGEAGGTDAARALPILDRMLKDRPNNVHASLLRAAIHEFLGEAENALRDAQAVLAAAPDSAVKPDGGGVTPVPNDELESLQNEALALMAWVYTEGAPDLDKAEKLAAKALEFDPGSPGILDTLAWIDYRRAMAEDDGQTREKLLTRAAAKAKRAVSRLPASSLLYHYVEIMLALKTDPETCDLAVTYLEAALEREPNFREADRAAALLDKLKSER